MLKETQQGKAWMEYLAVEPEVPGRSAAKDPGPHQRTASASRE